jgi:hypothetical protein
MPRKPTRRGTVRVRRQVVDKDTVGIKVTPVKPVMRPIKKARSTK